MLDKFGTDLTALAENGELDPVIGRVDEIEQTIEILSRRTKNNPVLIGEAGVGKTAIVEGLARAIVEESVPEALLGKRVISLDLPGMLAGTRYRGDFEERLTKTMEEIAAHKGELIIFIDEIHTVVGAGGSGDGGTDAGNILKPRLARGELHLVGATTLKEYRTIEKDPALERRFQPVKVGEPSIEDAVLILHGLKPAYEEHHGVEYTDAALRASVELSARYLTDRVLPDKAIDLIDQAGARLRLRLGVKTDVSALIARLADLEADKNAAVGAEHYEEASRIRDEISKVQAKLDEATAKGRVAASADAPSTVIDEAEIAAVISRATGIPVNRLTESERERLGDLEGELHARVIGQDDAVTAVAKAVRRSRTGMGDAKRPVGFVPVPRADGCRQDRAGACAGVVALRRRAGDRALRHERVRRAAHRVASRRRPSRLCRLRRGRAAHRARAAQPVLDRAVRRDREGAPRRVQPAAAGARRRTPDRRPGSHGRLPQHGDRDDLEPRFGVPRVALGCARVRRVRGWLGLLVAGRRAPARHGQGARGHAARVPEPHRRDRAVPEARRSRSCRRSSGSCSARPRRGSPRARSSSR